MQFLSIRESYLNWHNFKPWNNMNEICLYLTIQIQYKLQWISYFRINIIVKLFNPIEKVIYIQFWRRSSIPHYAVNIYMNEKSIYNQDAY